MKSFIYKLPGDSAEYCVRRIAVASGKINATPGIFERVASHSFADVNCVVSHLAVTLNNYFESFSDAN